MRERLIVWLRWQVGGRERPEDAVRAAERARDVTARFVAAGGAVLATISATVVAAFDPDETEDVLDLLLDLLAEQAVPGGGARREGDSELPGSGGGAATFAVCLGAVDTGPRGAASDASAAGAAASGAVGAAIDRAQLLAGRARGGEIVLDAEVRARAAQTFLFERTIGTGRLRGTTLDRRHPRRAPCREAVRRLGPLGIAPSHLRVFADLEHRLRAMAEEHSAGRSDAGGVVVLRGPHGSGARVLAAHLAERVPDTLLLELPAVVGGLEPLGSLAGALRAASARLAGLALPLEHAAVLAAVADGLAVPAAALAPSLDALSGALANGRGALVVLADPVSTVDPASLAAIAHLAARSRALFLARAPLDAPLPHALSAWTTDRSAARVPEPTQGAPAGAIVEQVLPPLRTSDALALASGLLGPETGDDVVRRVAVIGGDTPAGVEEAARTLVACGDLVFEANSWVWRSAERDRQSAAPGEELLAERLASCEEAPVRVLECLAVLGDRHPVPVVRAVALADGLEPGTFARALATARREGFITTEDPPALLPALLRKTLLDGMPAPRVAELHRYAAAARGAYAAEHAAAEGLSGARFATAAVGAHAREGGTVQEAARALLEAARVAAEHDWRDAARRLARAALDAHDDPAVRAAATSWLGDTTPDGARVETGTQPGLAAERGAAALAEVGGAPAVDRAPQAARGESAPPTAAGAPPAPAPLPAAVRGPGPGGATLEEPAAAAMAPVPAERGAAGPAGAPPTVEPRAGPGPGARSDGAAGDGGRVPAAVRAVAALRAGDAASLEALADRARAAGRPAEAADRVRAVASLVRGDTANALRILQRDRHLERSVGGAGASTRTALALALALHEAGDTSGAVRATLAALASARRARDLRGEEAALRAMARTFAALGRDADAARLEACALAREPAAGAVVAPRSPGPRPPAGAAPSAPPAAPAQRPQTHTRDE